MATTTASMATLATSYAAPQPVAPRRRIRTGFISSLNQLVLDAAPLATTPNAELFRARVVDPMNGSGSGVVVVVVVKRTRLATPSATRMMLCADDPIWELQVAAHVTDRGGHANIVRCLGAFLAHDATHLVMEHCAGGDLFHRLQSSSDGRLQQHDALDVLLQVARGLQFLHVTCNVAHRDVSVENVLVACDSSGNNNTTYKLCDFGLATEADVVSTAMVGKPQYMAPEVVAKRPYDACQADIWSLGILFFILLTGSPLVKCASASANDFRVVRVLGSRGVLQLWKMDALFSFATLDLLDGMLQVDPRDRFQDVGEILAHPALLAAAGRDHRRGGSAPHE